MNNNSQQRNFLIEFEERGHDLKQFKLYEEFLIECSQKNYEGIGTHKHHILPRNMGGSNKKQNLIALSYQDHYNAHLILANCFPIGDKRKGKNFSSAKIIVGWVKEHLSKKYEDITEQWEGFWELAHKEVSELNKGENNTFFGRKHSIESKQKISIANKGKRSRLGKLHSEETKKLLSQKHKIYQMNRIKPKRKQENGVYTNTKSNNLIKPWFRICPICHDEIYYNNLCTANMRERGKYWCLTCSANLIVFDSRCQIFYSSIRECLEYLNISRYKFDKLIENDQIQMI